MEVLVLQSNGKILVAHDPMNLIIIDLYNLKAIFIVTQVLLLQNLTRDILSQILDRLMTFDDEFMHGALLIDIGWHPHELLGDEFDLRNGQYYLVKCLEGDGEVVAIRTSYSALVLAMH